MKLQAADYFIRFTDGAHEHYQVAYAASIEAEQSEQRWRLRGHVSRQLSIYNRVGERFDKVGVDRRVELSPGGNDTETKAVTDWQGWRDCAFKPDSPLPEYQYEEIVEWLSRASAIAVSADKRRLENQFRHSCKGIEAISEID